VLTLGDLIISEAKNDGESSLSDDAGKTAERNALFWFVHLQSANNVAETTEEKSSQDVNAVDEDFFRITEKDLKVMHRCLKEEAYVHTTYSNKMFKKGRSMIS
jgi:hypothetical protein